MDPKTRNHLRVAVRNRDLTRTLLDPHSARLQPDPWEWVAVMAFYSAVHYVNAYIWERYGREPHNHGERTYAVRHDPAIRRCVSSYSTLRDAGYYARYSELAQVSERDERSLLQVDLRAVESTVMQALGEQPPVW